MQTSRTGPLIPLLAIAGGAALLLGACADDEPADTSGADAGEMGEGVETGTPAPDEDTTMPPGQDAGAEAVATATLQNAADTDIGTVTFTPVDGGITIVAEIDGVDAGLYGFHVHESGLCEPESAAPDDPGTTGAFLSAGSHIGADEDDHPHHTGDLPSVLVTADGRAALATLTDRLTAEELLDDDGSAVMLHDSPDNFANIPERYAEDGPDTDTLGTGDAGDRLACGVVEPAQ